MEAVKLNPKETTFQKKLIRLLTERKKFSEAKPYVKILVEQNPLDYEVDYF